MIRTKLQVKVGRHGFGIEIECEENYRKFLSRGKGKVLFCIYLYYSAFMLTCDNVFFTNSQFSLFLIVETKKRILLESR